MRWFSVREKSEPVILDLGYLQRLAKHIGVTETRELLADGMLDLTDRLELLESHGQNGDLKAVAELIHEIAGAAGHQGLTAMSHAAFQASRMARENPKLSAADLADQVLGYQEASLTALAQYCNGQDGDK